MRKADGRDDEVQVVVERCGVAELCRRNEVFRWVISSYGVAGETGMARDADTDGYRWQVIVGDVTEWSSADGMRF